VNLKLTVSLLALCLALSIGSVQAQTNVVGNMEDTSIILVGNTSETVTFNMTGNAVVVGMDNVSGKMENMTGAMGENYTGNMSQNQSMSQTQAQNMTGSQNQSMAANQTEAMTGRPVTCNVVGKVVIVKDMGNMTEKALMIGKMDKMPGKVVMFGNMSKMGGMAERMNNTSGIAGYMQNMTIVMVGNMNGTMTCNMTNDTKNMTGMSGNMVSRLENMTVLTAGNVTGTITCDLTRKMIIIRNIGDMDKVTEKICNISGRLSTKI
jgi:hypothetical protein